MKASKKPCDRPRNRVECVITVVFTVAFAALKVAAVLGICWAIVAILR